MDDANDDRWKQLVQIHFATKRLILHAEELGSFDHRTYIQPIREERDAFEHVCRATASHFEICNKSRDPAYIARSMDSACKHAVRAFFDAADWYGTLLRAGIRKRLDPYSHSCIRTVLPEYYPRIRARLDEIVGKIVQCREEKDSSDEPGTYDEVVRYGKLTLEIEGIYKEISAAIHGLEEVDKKEKLQQQADAEGQEQRQRAERPWSLVISIMAGLIVLAASTVSAYLLGRGSHPQPPRPGVSAPASAITR